MIVDGKGEHMTYNATDQILSYTNIQGKVFHYTYDGLNREIKELDQDNRRLKHMDTE